MILKLLQSKIGRLRIMGFLEGASLLFLIFIAMPHKYLFHIEVLTKMMGPIHGALFLLFVINAVTAGIEQNWKFKTIGLLMISCFVPFGTFYIDYKYLKHMN